MTQGKTVWDSFAGYSDMAALNDGQGVIMIFENGKKTFADSVCVHVRSLLFTYHSCYTLIAATIDSCSDLCAHCWERCLLRNCPPRGLKRREQNACGIYHQSEKFSKTLGSGLSVRQGLAQHCLGRDRRCACNELKHRALSVLKMMIKISGRIACIRLYFIIIVSGPDLKILQLYHLPSILLGTL